MTTVIRQRDHVGCHHHLGSPCIPDSSSDSTRTACIGSCYAIPTSQRHAPGGLSCPRYEMGKRKADNRPEEKVKIIPR